MDLKPRAQHQLYIQILRRMTPDQRLRKALELTELGRRLFADGLRHRYPNLREEEFRRLYLQHLAKCHNSNY